VRITDAHQHFWSREIITRLFVDGNTPLEKVAVVVRDFGPEGLKPIMDGLGIQQTVLVQVNSTMANTVDFLEIARTHDWVGGVVGWVDLTDPALGATLDCLLEHPKFKGARHQWEDEPDPAWIMRPEVVRGLRELAARRIPYDLLVKPPNWEYIPQLARAVPELALVIDHIAKPRIMERQFDDWARAMASAAQFPQVTCKLSGMITEADWQTWRPSDLEPYVDKVIELFGVERVMFGSDWPVCLLAGSYEQVFGALQKVLAHLSEHEQAMVLGETARGFYHLA
jgi:L-fuconolactonase